MVWASSVGKGSISIYYSATEIQSRVPDFDIRPVEVQQIPSADTVTALQNGAIDCGILLDPLWLQVADDPAYVLIATQTPGEPLGQISFGKNLLVDNPEVGEAFVRAFMRTINTYYAGDYHSDPEVMDEIAEADRRRHRAHDAGALAGDRLGDPRRDDGARPALLHRRRRDHRVHRARFRRTRSSTGASTSTRSAPNRHRPSRHPGLPHREARVASAHP